MPDRPAHALAAEAIGTFALCFIGILAINAGVIAGQPEGVVSLTTVALAHGLTIAVMVAALGAISGGHFNPAVTFGFVVTRRMDPVRGALYWAAQIGGAVAASLLLRALFGSGEPVAAGTPVLAPGVSAGAGIAVELVTTFFLVLVVFGTAVDERAPKSVFPFAIGLTVALDIMAIGPITGAAMNPARVLGPALASGMWDDHLVYWTGPLLGAAAAAWLWHGFLLARAPSPATATRGGPAPEEQRHVP
ncbi:MAG TPA: MIP family channel protein [Longimicrobiaceae bacterium]|nr:MIP family channel protein [Longimicrobiaceae bacterium]